MERCIKPLLQQNRFPHQNGDSLNPYNESDLDEIINLFYETVHVTCTADYTAQQLDAWAPAQPDRDAWAKTLAESDTLVARMNQKIAGFTNRIGVNQLDRLYVRAEVQKQGIAGALLRCMEQRAYKQGAAEMLVNVSKTALPFFMKEGYCVLCEQQVCRHGQLLINYAMRKALKSGEV